MFPEPFFRDATLFVALMAIGQALLLVSVGLGWRMSRRVGVETGVGAASGRSHTRRGRSPRTQHPRRPLEAQRHRQ